MGRFGQVIQGQGKLGIAADVFGHLLHRVRLLLRGSDGRPGVERFRLGLAVAASSAPQALVNGLQD